MNTALRIAREPLQPQPCTGGRYPLVVNGAWRRTCCADHWMRVHPGAWLHVVPEPDN